MNFRNESIEEFLNKLSSNSAVPGGGGAAALVSALSSALSCMVFNLTKGKKCYDELGIEEQSKIDEALYNSISMMSEFTEAINKDARAFNSLMDCYKLPKSNDEEKEKRSNSIESGLKNAMQVPLELAQNTLKVMDDILVAAEFGNKNVVSDAGVAAILAYGAIESSILNVKVNLNFINNIDKSEIITDCANILQEAQCKKDKIMKLVYGRI